MATEEIIEMQNDLVIFYNKEITRQVKLEDFLSRVESTKPVTLPQLARSQVFAHYDETIPEQKKFFALTEIPAGIKSISKNIGYDNARRYRLAMPYTFMWFVATGNIHDEWSFSDYRCFHSRTAYAGIDTPMIGAKLPNVYSDGRICWGSTGTSPNQSVADRLDHLTNGWYLSRFNTDLDRETAIPYNEPHYGRWVRESRENPMCWMDWPEWHTDTNYTVRSLLTEAQIDVRPAILTLPGAIPEIPVAPTTTYGGWEEWWRTNFSDPLIRGRAALALNNYQQDNPDDVLIEAAVEAEFESSDDGGVEIPHG